jgi:hypothetical protein
MEKLKRKSHYKKLREAGYSASDANRFKDRETFVVLELVKIKQESQKQLNNKLKEVL